MNYEEILDIDTPVDELLEEEERLHQEIHERQLKANLIAKMILLRYINANS